MSSFNASQSPDARILLVEDTPALARTYRAFLASEPYTLDHVESGLAAQEALKNNAYDLVLLDLRLPDISGEDVMAWMRKTGLDVPVIVVTAQGSVGVAVEAMRAGAVDFLMKPFTEDRLVDSTRHHLESRKFLKNAAIEAAAPVQAAPQEQKTSTAAPRQIVETGEGLADFIGESLPMRAVYRSVQSASGSNATVFITGESGSGKEVCANAIHKLGPRKNKEFVALNCAAIPGELMESEIFGHVKGAFTGATADKVGAARFADGGTLFLDEICEMAPHLQTKLLRFIQTGSFNPVGQVQPVTVDARFVCATNRDPLAEVVAGRFREDLYYRLHVIPIKLPPLRDRGDDVLRIALHLLRQYGAEEGKVFERIGDDAKAALLAYPWPGNVRQLQNILRHAVVFGDGPELTASMLRDPVGNVTSAPRAEASRIAPQSAAMNRTAPEPSDLNALSQMIRPLEVVERETIEEAVRLCGNDVRKAAVFLGVSPATIYRKQKTWRDGVNV